MRVCLREYLMLLFSGKKRKREKRGDYGVTSGFLPLHLCSICQLWVEIDLPLIVKQKRANTLRLSLSMNVC